MSGEVFYGRSVRQSEGSWTAKGIVGQRSADGRKFLLLFRTTLSTLLSYVKMKNEYLNGFWRSSVCYCCCEVYFQCIKKSIFNGNLESWRNQGKFNLRISLLREDIKKERKDTSKQEREKEKTKVSKKERKKERQKSKLDRERERERLH